MTDLAYYMGRATRDLRSRRGLTQEHLAELTGVSVRTVARIEAGETLCQSTYGQILEGAGWDPSELLVRAAQLAGLDWGDR